MMKNARARRKARFDAVGMVAPSGPYVIKGSTLPDSVPGAIKDIQPYIDGGNNSPALEFLSPVKGPSLEQITVAVGSGQIYVLSHQGNGSSPASYRIDVYTPNGAPLATNSPGTNIPHLAVDYWRSIFAANYTPLSDSSTGQPHIDPALGVAEPSLSRLDPTS